MVSCPLSIWLTTGRLNLPGVYALVLELSEDVEISVGRLGNIPFRVGAYAYVGSAMGGVGTRLSHHLRSHSQTRWHIDYLLAQGLASSVVVGLGHQRVECQLAGQMAQRFQTIPRFGSSDCRCPGHLFHGPSTTTLAEVALEATQQLGCASSHLSIDDAHEPSSQRGSGSSNCCVGPGSAS